MNLSLVRRAAAALLAASAALTAVGASAAPVLLNVSYDPTRELYRDYNRAFANYWGAHGHGGVSVRQSHGGSGKQARAVIDGLQADVVTLALGYDIDSIQKAGLITPGWQSRFPNNSTPFTSTIVLVVRKGNPKHIHDWSDLIRSGISVVSANPKTSGGARWNYLAAWGYASKKAHGNQASARAFVSKLYHNVAVLDTGSRGATTSFVQRGIGDVLIAWENEAQLIQNKIGQGQYQIVYPSISVLAEPPVALVDRNVDKHGTRPVATAYLNYLYSGVAQTIAAKNYYRPRNPVVAAHYAAQFPQIRLFTVDQQFGGWQKAQRTHFADGGVFDQIERR